MDEDTRLSIERALGSDKKETLKVFATLTPWQIAEYIIDSDQFEVLYYLFACDPLWGQKVQQAILSKEYHMHQDKQLIQDLGITILEPNHTTHHTNLG